MGRNLNAKVAGARRVEDALTVVRQWVDEGRLRLGDLAVDGIPRSTLESLVSERTTDCHASTLMAVAAAPSTPRELRLLIQQQLFPEDRHTPAEKPTLDIDGNGVVDGDDARAEMLKLMQSGLDEMKTVSEGGPMTERRALAIRHLSNSVQQSAETVAEIAAEEARANTRRQARPVAGRIA